MTSHAFPPLRRVRTSVRSMLLPCIVLAAVSALANPPAAAPSSGALTVQLASLTPHLRAYAQVEPIATLPINAPETGTLARLTVIPGTPVRAGQTLATLRGPAVQILLRQDQANLRSARVQLSEALQSLAIQRRQLRAHLSTRQAVHQAAGALAKAQAALANAQSQLTAVRQMATLIAPASGLVTMLNASNGELVTAGQPVLTLQPANALSLRATYYGRNIRTIHPGMQGTFQPSDASPPIPVRVQSIAGIIGPNGGESVLLAPLHPRPKWLSGEFGVVTLHLPTRHMVVVPTRALILSQGKWWVMVHTPHGDQPRRVVPGPAQGWNTFISSGLVPGDQVIVTHPYLLFHSSIAEHFQIPD